MSFSKEILELPGFKDEYERIKRRHYRAQLVFGWTRRIPLVGSLVWVFWSCLVTEGLRSTAKPRWGALTFSFLNDGMKPTPWHTVYSIIHDNTAPYSGIYPSGAPKSLKQAQEWGKEER